MLAGERINTVALKRRTSHQVAAISGLSDWHNQIAIRFLEVGRELRPLAWKSPGIIPYGK